MVKEVKGKRPFIIHTWKMLPREGVNIYWKCTSLNLKMDLLERTKAVVVIEVFFSFWDKVGSGERGGKGQKWILQLHLFPSVLRRAHWMLQILLFSPWCTSFEFLLPLCLCSSAVILRCLSPALFLHFITCFLKLLVLYCQLSLCCLSAFLPRPLVLLLRVPPFPPYTSWKHPFSCSSPAELVPPLQ